MAEGKGEKALNLGTWIFLFTLILSTIANLVFGSYDILTALSFNASSFAITVLAALDIAYYAGIIGLIAYTAYSVYKFRPNAIPLAKAFLLVLLAQGIVLLAIGWSYNDPLNIQAIPPVAYSAIWLAYLAKSKTVDERFPKAERRLYNRDKLLAACIVAVYASMMWLLLFFAMQGEIYGAEPTYQDCVTYYGAEECNQQIYEWCMEDFDDLDFCTEYKSCLDTFQDDEYCTSEYFGLTE